MSRFPALLVGFLVGLAVVEPEKSLVVAAVIWKILYGLFLAWGMLCILVVVLSVLILGLLALVEVVRVVADWIER